jgi:hypothetical protein
MTLSAVRDIFLRDSGRFDLGTIGGSDNGADRHINEGQNMLDRMTNFDKSNNRIFDNIDADGWYLNFAQRARAIHEVWVNNADGERWKLQQKDWSWLHAEFPDAIADTDSGEPLYWCPSLLRSTEHTDMDSLAAMFNNVIDNDELYSGIVILGPTDAALTVEVVGLFYSVALSGDDDTSYWTEVHPEILSMAACYRLEVINRNTAGMKDWLYAIERELKGIESDAIEQATNNIDQMEG